MSENCFQIFQKKKNEERGKKNKNWAKCWELMKPSDRYMSLLYY